MPTGTPLIATHGWTRASTLTLAAAIDRYSAAGLRHVLCTDIDRDGALDGPEHRAVRGLREPLAGDRVPGVGRRARRRRSRGAHGRGCRGDASRAKRCSMDGSNPRRSDHSYAAHNPLPRRPRRRRRQRRAVPRPPRRRRHHDARRALSRRRRRRARVLRHHGQPRSAHRRPHVGEPNRARARHSVLRRRRHSQRRGRRNRAESRRGQDLR